MIRTRIRTLVVAGLAVVAIGTLASTANAQYVSGTCGSSPAGGYAPRAYYPQAYYPPVGVYAPPVNYPPPVVVYTQSRPVYRSYSFGVNFGYGGRHWGDSPGFRSNHANRGGHRGGGHH